MTYSIRTETPADVRQKLIEYSDLSARLLHNRGITDRESAVIFFNPNYETHSHDPFLLKDAEKSADRIIYAIKNNEKIVIYSDYDTDGIPAGAMFADFFRRIGFTNFSNYIPHRHDEGFGLNNEAIIDIADNGARLLITLDCGITDVEPTKLAREKNIDVIITDHHTPPLELPPAFAIVNPKQADCNYPFKELCGAGVGWKLIQSILKKERFGLKDGQEKWLLDLVGIATLSDMVPLQGENRMLAHYGLAVLRKSPRKGLVRLLQKIGVKQKDIVEDDIGFSIGPRINAASRMGEAMDAFRLLSTDDENEAEHLAENLDHINNERKGIVAGLVKEVKRKMENRKMENRKIIVIGNPNWRPSLLGLVANTCAEEYGCSFFVWGRDGDGLIKGSCRTTDGDSVHLVELMTATPAGTFTQFGGHVGAGGFTVQKEAVYNLEEILNKTYVMLKNNKLQNPNDKLMSNDKKLVDSIISADSINWDLFDEINRFAPFGTDNPKPIFMVKDAIIAGVKHFGKEKNHLEILLQKESGQTVPAIAFFKKAEDFSTPLEIGKTVSIIGTLEKSTFKWKPELRIRILDVL
ncbi:MAG: single-stranded-DNA-specific exonuclease RecJ [Patescibacteria group bacterium]|nr:single-stranded-DNA-specific exonuclease RecJ [Patescibacteria group bacterium]